MEEQNLFAQNFTPSQVGEYIKGTMDRDAILKKIVVEGEISGYKFHAPSGNHYFSLKDEKGVLVCMMYKYESKYLRCQPKNGDLVLAEGRISVYPRDGRYQMYCRRLSPLGVGDLHQQFEDLKEKLAAQGLFDENRKKPLPFLPKRVALLTSPSGAVVHDMLRVMRARCPITHVYIVPVAVQGAGAAEEMAAAIGWVNRNQLADVMIVGRGGGSQEDLWAFNEEVLAWAIAHSEIPIISAVGHEPDVSISDYVADCRASTPTFAAKIVVPDVEELKQQLGYLQQSLVDSWGRGMDYRRQALRYLQQSPVMQDPREILREKSQILFHNEQQLLSSFQMMLQQKRGMLGQSAAALHALSPLDVLGRGYGVLHNHTGDLLHSVDQATIGEKVSVELSDGLLSCRVDEVRKKL